jgi:2-isopropylmalate synthase
LNDFKVRILDSKKATAATTRVMIETTDGINKWDTVGVNANIIEASYMAIVDSITYGLILSEAK